MMSSQYLIDGLPHEIEEWLHTAVDAEIGRINLLAYTLARLGGLDPTQSVASAVLFEMDADRTWTNADKPTRGELFATAERTILQPPAPTHRKPAPASLTVVLNHGQNSGPELAERRRYAR
jgi:hypothetical protein